MSDKIEHYKAGLKLFGENKFEEAIAEYKLALEIDDKWEDGLHAIAMAYMSAGKLDDAIETANFLLTLNPNDPFIHTSLSMFYQRKGMIDEAETESAKARMASWKLELKTNPDAPPPGPAGSLDVIQ